MTDVDFQTNIHIRYMNDHVAGTFQWDVPPSCCDRFLRAFDEKTICVSNSVNRESDGDPFSTVYIQPVTATGELLRERRVGIEYCPSCGTEIQVRKSNF